MARWTISGPRAKMVTSYRANSDYNWPICAPASNVKRANRVHVGQSKSSQSRRKYRKYTRNNSGRDVTKTYTGFS